MTSFSSHFQIPVLSMGAHGGTRVLVDFANEAAKSGARVRFLVPSGGVDKIYALHAAVEVKEIGTDKFGKFAGQILFLLACPFYMRWGFLIANFFPTYYSVLLARFMFRRPYLYFVQDIETWSGGGSGWFLNLACRLSWRCQRMVATSPSIAAKLARLGHPVWQQVKVGVSPAFFVDAEREKDKHYDLVCFPRREAWKRFDLLEKIFSAYRRRFGALRVLCISMDALLLSQCQIWGGDGVMPQDEAALIAALDSARVLLFTSEREGLGLPPLEAMARGLPCVVCDNEGIRTYLEDEVNGFMVAAGDCDAAVERLHELLSDDFLYAGMSLAAQRKAREFSTSRGFAGLLEGLY